MKISIVTPSFNSGLFIKEAIYSVISQNGNFSIEYFVIDNFSTDGTREIVEQFQQLILSEKFPIGCNGVELSFIVERDQGMYDAINKGFEKATGDVFAWLNADDIYLPGALATIMKVFATYDDVHWAKGITSYITEETSIRQAGRCYLYIQDWIKFGVYGRDNYFIQQDSVFWRAWLWKKSGGIDTRFKRAGDYYLWVKFAESAPLVSVSAFISCFRNVKGQLSEDLVSYLKEVNSFSPGKNVLSTKVSMYIRIQKLIPSLFLLRWFLFKILFRNSECSVITIGKDGKIDMITGEYCKISRIIG